MSSARSGVSEWNKTIARATPRRGYIRGDNAKTSAGRKAGPNPWGSLTLEWTNASSPPIEHNFDHEPVVVHGPYDYDNVIPPQTKPGDYILPRPAAVALKH